MNPKPITNFAAQFGVKIALNQDLMLEKNGRFYLVNPTLKQITQRDFFYTGIFLGKAKEGKFFPSYILLGMLAKKGAHLIVLDKKASWLFICGRDVLGKSIVRIQGSGRKNTNTLVLNEFGECLGFGRIVENLNGPAYVDQIVVRNVSDVGDFLRRER